MIKINQIIASFVLVAATALSAVADSCDSCDSCQCSQNGSCQSSSPCKDCLSACKNCMCARKACYMHHSWMRAQRYNWHANYAHSAYGQPIALVVPPTAQMQTNWSWGAPSARFSRIDHQFGRDYPGPGAGSGVGFRNTPAWPGDTAQFGVHYVRGPWYPIQR